MNHHPNHLEYTLSITSAAKIARSEAAIAKARAAEARSRLKEALHRAKFREESIRCLLVKEKLRRDILWGGVVIIGTFLTSIAVGVAVLGLWLRQGG